MVRSVATKPKTGFTGVILVASFARFRISTVVPKAGTTPSPPRRWELSVMVETRGSYEEAVRREGREEEPEPQ